MSIDLLTSDLAAERVDHCATGALEIEKNGNESFFKTNSLLANRHNVYDVVYITFWLLDFEALSVILFMLNVLSFVFLQHTPN